MNAVHSYSSLPNVNADDNEISRYGLLLDNLGIGLLVYSLDALPCLTNKTADKLLGETQPVWMDANGQPIPTDQLPQKQVLSSEQPVLESILTICNDATNRTWLSVNALPVFSESGRIRRVLLTLNDITDLRELQLEIGRLTTHDSLTGTFNKDVITHLLENEIRRAQRYGTPFTVAQIEIDFFQSICEKHGKLIGDLVLAGIGKMLVEGVREIDRVGRIGNQEFLVILPNVRLNDATIGMERLRSMIEEQPLTPDNLPVTVSGGIAEYAGETSATLLERSKSLLIHAHEDGHNRLYLDPDIL